MPEDTTSKDIETTVPKPTTGTAKPGTNGLAIAAMVVGIVSVLFGWAPFFGVLVGATAIVLAVIALKKAQNKAMSVTGLVTGIVGGVWSLIMTLLMITALALVGGSAAVVGQALNEQNQIAKEQADAPKDFKKGDTAKFGQFEVKVNSVQRNYTPAESYMAAPDGKELIVVNLTVKNTGESASLTNYDLNLSVNGVESNDYTSATVQPEFTGGTMEKNASVTGNIVYEVTKGASDMKLTYKTSTFSYTNGDSGLKTYTYTLEI